MTLEDEIRAQFKENFLDGNALASRPFGYYLVVFSKDKDSVDVLLGVDFEKIGAAYVKHDSNMENFKGHIDYFSNDDYVVFAVEKKQGTVTEVEIKRSDEKSGNLVDYINAEASKLEGVEEQHMPELREQLPAIRYRSSGMDADAISKRFDKDLAMHCAKIAKSKRMKKAYYAGAFYSGLEAEVKLSAEEHAAMGKVVEGHDYIFHAHVFDEADDPKETDPKSLEQKAIFKVCMIYRDPAIAKVAGFIKKYGMLYYEDGKFCARPVTLKDLKSNVPSELRKKLDSLSSSVRKISGGQK